MDESEPKTATKKRSAATAVVSTPSPSRRRRRRLLTGSSPGCVPRPAGASVSSISSSASSSSSAATTPSRALRTPPPRRLLPPSSASAKRHGAMAPPPRVARSAASSVLRLDDAESEEGDGDSVSTGDDAFSIISGDGSPERDRHVLDFLAFNSLADGTPAFTLFTPSPAASKTSSLNFTRTIQPDLTVGLLTPQASPVRSRGNSISKQEAVSPSHFLRSPYAPRRSSLSTSSSSSPGLEHVRRRDKTVYTDEEEEDKDVEENELEPEPRRSITRSPRTPLFRVDVAAEIAVKHEALPEAIVCTLPEGMRPSASRAWRRNSLSLMRTPSPAASAKAKALRARAHLLRSAGAGRDPFADSDDDLSCAPSALQGGAHDQDWLFSFANTLSPLAQGSANEEDLETSFLSLRFSPASSSSIDLQRLLPPFPSPGFGPRESIFQTAPPPKTPVQTTGTSSSLPSSSSSSTGRSASACRSSGSSCSSSRELNESFPNIRASTSATPGRSERLKVSSSSVMKMKLHVSFDEFPVAHTKREIEAINNSLKRKKQARKRKLDEGKQRQQKTNSKGLNVQRKLLHTPVKDDQQMSAESNRGGDAESGRVKPKYMKNRPALKSLNGRSTQRKLLDATDETKDNGDAVGASARKASDPSSTDARQAKAASDDSSSSLLRRRLSPTLGNLSVPNLPSTLTGTVLTPSLHPLKLRKSPLAVKTVAASPIVASATEKTTLTPAPSAAPLQKPLPAAPVTVHVPQQKPPPSMLSSVSSQSVMTSTPIKTPLAKQQQSIVTTPLAASTVGFAASSKILSMPTTQSVPLISAAKGMATLHGAAGNPKKVHCNCKKSKCLKLYCECFANGEHCDELCNCVGCCNTPAHEDVRQQAIASRLEKNPNAFKPKIELTVVTMTPGGMTPSRSMPGFSTPHNDHPHPHHHSKYHRHHPLVHGKGDLSGDLKKMHKHGCHCKKSGCQKRYCECFQAGVPCGENCRCIDCKNHSPYSVKNPGVTTPLSAISVRGPRGGLGIPTAATPDANGDQFVSPTLQSVRQRLRIDRETWARNFSSPFEVSPRRERERTERLRAQLKSSRASALLRSFNATSAASTQAEVVVKTEQGMATVAHSSALSFRVDAASSFASPPGQVMTIGGPKLPQSLSPLSDATRPPPAPTPHGKDARSRHLKRFAPYNPHALEALAINRTTSGGRVYVLPLFGDALPPVKTDVSATIFHFLTNADVYNASLVNRLWSRVTTGDTVWDHHNFRRVPRHLHVETTPHPNDGDVKMQA